MMETLYPLLFRRTPKDAAVIPFPRDETTPPVTNMYFGMKTLLPKQFYLISKLDQNNIWPSTPNAL
jgi:hypothetical protein